MIGRPVDLGRLPKRGGLQIIDSVTLTTGGIVSNVGIDLAKLGFRVAAITRVGKDSLGQVVVQQYRAYGIDTTGVIIDAKKQTSATMVCVSGDGERSFLHTRGCMTSFRVADVLDQLSIVQRAKILAFGYLGLLQATEKDFPKLFRSVKEKTSAKILLDTGGNPRVSPGLLKTFLPYVDYFLPSFEEAAQLTGYSTPESITRFLVNAGASGVVGVKLGSKGAYIKAGNHGEYIHPQKVRKVVDATGAGDAFVAGFLGATLRGYNPFESARIAGSVAADCITAVGASTAIRSFEHYAGKSSPRPPGDYPDRESQRRPKDRVKETAAP